MATFICDTYNPESNSAQRPVDREETINDVPLWERYTLTIREAARYFHIGEKKLRQLVQENATADYILMVGNRAMIKRKKFENWIDRADCL